MKSAKVELTVGSEGGDEVMAVVRLNDVNRGPFTDVNSRSGLLLTKESLRPCLNADGGMRVQIRLLRQGRKRAAEAPAAGNGTKRGA